MFKPGTLKHDHGKRDLLKLMYVRHPGWMAIIWGRWWDFVSFKHLDLDNNVLSQLICQHVISPSNMTSWLVLAVVIGNPIHQKYSPLNALLSPQLLGIKYTFQHAYILYYEFMKPHWTKSLWIMKRINSSSRRICNAIYWGGDTKKNILQSNVNSTCLCRTRNKNLGLLFQYYHNAIIRQCYAFGLVAGTILFLSWTLLLVAFVIIAPLRIVCVACWWLLLFWRICISGKSSSTTHTK